jgi:2-hydroxy-6-oxonona-2,4-dienedioate hydrolase
MRRSRVLAIAVLLALLSTVLILYASTAGPKDGPRRPVKAVATAYAQRDIVVNGLRLRYVDEGAGEPIILLPGHTSRVEEYESLIGELRGGYRVLVFDWPGSGYSDKPEREYDLRFYEDTVLGFMDGLGIERCMLGGGSLGGNLALRLAHRSPERFTRIAAWSPAGAWPKKPAPHWFMTVFGGRVLFWPMVKIQSTYWYRPDWKGKDEALAATFTYYHEVMSPGFVAMYWGIAADQLVHPLVDEANDIEAPVMLMWGDQDHGFDIGTGIKQLHQELPHSELVVFKETGHSILTERPEEFTKTLKEFLARPASD